MKITLIDHACVMLTHAGKVVVIDPFVRDIGLTRAKYPEFFRPDYILLTHGHDDHMGSLGDIIAPQTEVICIVELASFLSSRNIPAVGLNFGGTISRDGMEFSLVPAVHSSASEGIYLGQPAGFVVKMGNRTIYHAGDTDAFCDMRLISEFYHPNIGLIPIGGRYTMDERKAAYACNEFFSFQYVIPIHYNTFPAIQADPALFEKLTNSKTVVLAPLQKIEII